jgi:hypothetical protein
LDDGTATTKISTGSIIDPDIHPPPLIHDVPSGETLAREEPHDDLRVSSPVDLGNI